MITEYIHRITIAVPNDAIENANHLAAIIGESPADNQTFLDCSYCDANGGLYSVASFVAKPSVLAASTVLPDTPSFAVGGTGKG